MTRPAPIWEPAPPETSACSPPGPVRRLATGLTFTTRLFERRCSGVVAHLAAHLGEEPPLGGGDTVDSARPDLVEHAVDLRLRGVPLDAALRLWPRSLPGAPPPLVRHD